MKRPTMLDLACYYAYCHLLPYRFTRSRLGMWLLERAGNYAYWDNELANDRLMDAMVMGTPWSMALASYHYSRSHGLSVWEALGGAWDLWRAEQFK